jgi:DNA-directed RNA polymerase specialized sigma24 family protein
MQSDSSVSDWIAGLKFGDWEAAKKLWERYAVRLVELARWRLGDAPKGIADEEDIAQSVFRTVCQGAAAGRFEDLRTRDELWWLLMAVTKQKALDHVRSETAQKRGSGRVQCETALAADDDGSKAFMLDRLVGDDPTPDFLVMLEEQHGRLLSLLRDDHLRRIAVLRIEGYIVEEIASKLAVSTRSIERKLRLIRKQWAQDFAGINS